MNILFTPAGDSDPARGLYDGAILQILRHYPVDKVILYLTKEMEKKEIDFQCYTRGIQHVAPHLIKNKSVRVIFSHITEPQDYEALTPMIEEFEQAYKDNPGAFWLLNVSSGTPQMKTIMTLFALEYDRTKVIHVDTPEKSSNRANHPASSAEELVEMLDCNINNDPKSPNRCSEPPLSVLRRHGLKLQIESLIQNYDYDGALQIVQRNKSLFSDDTLCLIQHGAYRLNLSWRKANQIISSYDGKQLLPNASDFSEYFQVMELRQQKGQLADFVVKLSPVLMDLGWKYLETLKNTDVFDILQCGHMKKEGTFKVERNAIECYNADMLAYVEKNLYGDHLRSGALYFNIVVYIFQFLAENTLKNDERHQKITDIFIRLRNVEKNARNLVAHNITNMTEEKLIALQKEGSNRVLTDVALNSKDIMKLLHEAVKLIYGKDIALNFGILNKYILDSFTKQ